MSLSISKSSESSLNQNERAAKLRYIAAMGKKALNRKKKEFTERIGVAMKPRLRRALELDSKRKGEDISEYTRKAIELRMRA